MVREYFVDGKRLFRASVVRTSKKNPAVTVRKTKTGIHTLQEAKRIERRLEKLVLRLVTERENDQEKWETLVERWELSVRRDCIFTSRISVRTLADYLSVIHKHTSDWMSLPVNRLDKAQVWRRLHEVESSLSISRQKKLRSAIDSVLKWAALSGALPKSFSLPTEGYRATRKEEEKKPEILTIEEVRTLLKRAKELKHPWYPVWAVALHTGMRSGELISLRWQNVDMEGAVIFVHENWTNKTGFGPTKGRYWRTVPINSELASLLKELKGICKGSEFVLPRFQAWKDGRQAEVLRAFCVGVGLPSIRFHSLRSCACTALLRDGVAPVIVMQIFGWKSLQVMERYLRLAGSSVAGATEGLKFLPPSDAMGRVVKLFGSE
ncbi:MAG: site-specific integrase [Bdellovibrionaceae bacterium]|nr:site-specific integrase [Pseudobdellovibrionaceae bacterium]